MIAWSMYVYRLLASYTAQSLVSNYMCFDLLSIINIKWVSQLLHLFGGKKIL